MHHIVKEPTMSTSNAPPDQINGFTAGTIVYAAEFGSPPDASELTVLNQFTQAQFDYGQQIGVMDPSVYAYQSLGVALATGQHFQNEFGPSNSMYSASAAGDALFVTDAYAIVFGHAGTAAQVQQFADQLNYFETLYTAAGMFGNPSNIDLLARGAVYGQMLGIEHEPMIGSPNPIIFQGNFNTGSTPMPIDSNIWHYATGDASYYGITHQRESLPDAANGIMRLQFDSYNPANPGNQVLGSAAISGGSQANPLLFHPTDTNGLAFIAEAKYETNPDGSIPRGIIGGFMFLYSDTGNPNTHDEIDFEGMSNNPTQIQTNIYHNAPPGNGDPISYNFPNGPSNLATFHKYEIDWYTNSANPSTNEVVWKVDGTVVRTATGNQVPTQDMALHFNIWTGEAGWPTSDPATQPTSNPSADQKVIIDVQNVQVEQIPPHNEIAALVGIAANSGHVAV